MQVSVLWESSSGDGAVKKKRLTKPVLFNTSWNLWVRLEAYAKEKHVTYSATIRRALHRYLKEEGY